MSDPFADIRPYADDEVDQVLIRLLNNREFTEALSRYRFPRMQKWASPLAQGLMKSGLKFRFREIHSIAHFQQKLTPIFKRLLKRTTRKVHVRGIKNLQKDRAYLFISNHRDIAMDPGLVNLALVNSKFPTCQIGIGDNLLSQNYVADLMRLNRSFVVKRSVSGRKEKLAALQHLSDFILDSIESGNSIWLAQREGRAKDGFDETDTAVLKMLYLAGRKRGWTLSQTLKALNLVPVSLSYEKDPCDLLKAHELHVIATQGTYRKSEGEDLRSIITGLQGDKGQVCVSFGAEVKLDNEDAQAWAAHIDKSIYQNYMLFSRNYLAAREVDGKIAADAFKKSHHNEFNQALAQVPEHLRPYWLNMYAKPVLMQNAAKN